jgi:hypothetical protein
MRRSYLVNSLRATAVLLCLMLLTPVGRASATAAALPSSGVKPALLSITPLPSPLPVTRGDYRTISWISYADYQYYVDTSYIAYGSYLASNTTTQNAGDSFQYATLRHDAVFSIADLDQIRTSINDVTLRNPNFGKAGYKFSFQFWGHTDVRCNDSNAWNTAVKEDEGVASPCAEKSSDYSEGSFVGKAPDPAIAPFTKNYNSATYFKYTPGNALLAKNRAMNLREQVSDRYTDRRKAADWALAAPYNAVYGAGEWFTWQSSTTCNEARANCASERIAELIIVQTYTYNVSTSSIVPRTSTVNATTSSVVSIAVNCEYYGTCLAEPDFTLAQPAVKLTSFQQQGTRTLSIPAATVSCPGCKAPVSSGAPTTGWTATVESATLSGVSLTPPRGYTTPKQFSFKAPGSNLTSAQKITLTLNKATLAAAPYKLNPGTVTATVRMDPWLWDGQTLTWLTSNTTRVKKTVPLTCSISTSCKFGVLGSNTAG